MRVAYSCGDAEWGQRKRGWRETGRQSGDEGPKIPWLQCSSTVLIARRIASHRIASRRIAWMPDGMGCMQMPASRAVREARYPFEPVDRAAVRDQTRVRSKPSSPSSHQASHCPSRPQSKRAIGEIAPAAATVRRCLSIPKWRDVGVPLSAAAKCGARNLNARAVVVGMQCQELERTICSAVVRAMIVVVRRSSRRQQSLQHIKTTAD